MRDIPTLLSVELSLFQPCVIDSKFHARLMEGMNRSPRLLPAAQLLKLLQRHSFAEQEALKFVAAVLHQVGELRIGFDAFGDDVQAEIGGDADDRPHHRPAVLVMGDVANEGLVDF